jgi:hypothetical protein
MQLVIVILLYCYSNLQPLLTEHRYADCANKLIASSQKLFSNFTIKLNKRAGIEEQAMQLNPL